MLDQYKCVGMVLIINFNNITYPAGIKIATSQILLFGGYLKARESFYTQLLFGSIPLCLIDTRMIVPRYGGSYML